MSATALASPALGLPPEAQAPLPDPPVAARLPAGGWASAGAWAKRALLAYLAGWGGRSAWTGLQAASAPSVLARALPPNVRLLPVGPGGAQRSAWAGRRRLADASLLQDASRSALQRRAAYRQWLGQASRRETSFEVVVSRSREELAWLFRIPEYWRISIKRSGLLHPERR